MLYDKIKPFGRERTAADRNDIAKAPRFSLEKLLTELYFCIAEIIFDEDFTDVFPDELTEEQMRILTDIADLKEGEWEISLIQLKEKGLLKYFGIYDKMLTIWNNICKLIVEEISDDRENRAGSGREK